MNGVSTFVPEMIFIDTFICERCSSETFFYFFTNISYLNAIHFYFFYYFYFQFEDVDNAIAAHEN